MTDGMVARHGTALRSIIDCMEARREGAPRDLWRAALALEHVVLSDLLSPEEEQSVLERIQPSRLQVCREIMCALETMIEESFATLVVGGGEAIVLRSDSITENYLTRYEELARREIALAGITAADRVLFIGSGPLPITAIEYCRRTGCRVECVDYVPQAVEISRAVLRRLDLDRQISCRQARGETVAANEFSVVLVGVLAQPKQEIFQSLHGTCAPECRIIARTTFGLRGLIYQAIDLDESAFPGLRRAGKSEARADQIISAYLYRRSE